MHGWRGYSSALGSHKHFLLLLVGFLLILEHGKYFYQLFSAFEHFATLRCLGGDFP